jgi:hypothetical protein
MNVSGVSDLARTNVSGVSDLARTARTLAVATPLDESKHQ